MGSLCTTAMAPEERRRSTPGGFLAGLDGWQHLLIAAALLVAVWVWQIKTKKHCPQWQLPSRGVRAPLRAEAPRYYGDRQQITIQTPPTPQTQIIRSTDAGLVEWLEAANNTMTIPGANAAAEIVNLPDQPPTYGDVRQEEQPPPTYNPAMMDHVSLY